MKLVLPLCLLFAFTALAHAQQPQQSEQPQPQPPQQSPQPPQKPDTKPVPDLNKSPWSGMSINRYDGLTGDSTTVIKRDIGGGWAIGGQMTAPYQDPKIGGTGVPPPPQLDRPAGHTLFGPYLEKKF